MLSKRVENTVGKGEIARYEQILLFLQCFQKACFPGATKGVIVWEWVNTLKSIARKGQNALSSIFSISHNVFKRVLPQDFCMPDLELF